MNFALLQFLSGALIERLNITPTELLSAFNTLSAIPVGPYDRAKYELFGPDYKFTTFQEIEAPKEFTLKTARTELSSYKQRHNENVQTLLSAQTLKYSEGIDIYKEDIIIDQNIAKKNIIFTEAIKTLTVEEIDADPEGVAKRVLSFYLSL